MEEKQLEKVYRKNAIFVILIGITGFCFGLLDWDTNLADLVYLKYSNAFLISVVSANIGTARLLATFVCIKVNSWQKPNSIFITCMVLCSLVAIITAILFDAEYIILFVIAYLLETILLEIFSGYQYAYAYHSLPEEKAMYAHSKRIAVFKLLQAGGIAVAGYVCSKFINHAFLIISILTTLVFIVTIIFAIQVKNFPKSTMKRKEKLTRKLNIFQYTPYFRKWFTIRALGRFALTSLVVLLSIRAIDNELNLVVLKSVKSLLWILSGIGFFMSSYFIKKNVIVNGDIIIKACIAILLPLVFIYPPILFIIILLTGILNPFNTMSHLEMLRRDTDNIDVPQKDMLINLVGYIAQMVSAYILLNINSNIAIIFVMMVLLISIILEYKLYKSTEKKIAEE